MVLSKWINKSHLWILIICLIILITNVLLVAGYAQIKYNKTLSLKNRDILDEKEAILKDNNDLKNTINDLKEDLDEEKRKTADTEQKYKAAKEKNANTLNMYEDLIEAELLKKNGDLTGAAVSLKSVNKDYLWNNAAKLESDIRSEVFKPAAEYFYKAGYEDYIKGNYEKAIDKFNKSIYFIQDENFKDDSIFYLGESYYQSGNREMAKNTAKKLIDNFPDSEYIKEAKKLYTLVN